jgi:thiol-disulfide isomerase/thioredoxin
MNRLTAAFLGLSLASMTTIPLSAKAAITQNAVTPTSVQMIAQASNVGGALAKKLQGKPVVVDIYASWCPACKNIAPTMAQLKRDYAGKATFVVFDVSDQGKTAKSKALAKQLGLSKFLAENMSQTGLVAIVDPANGNILTQHRNNSNKSDYASVLDAAIR